MERKRNSIAKLVTRSLLSGSVFGLLAICPAMADSYATHISTSVAQSNAGNMANTSAHTNSHAMGYGRQNYYNQHLMPQHYYGNNDWRSSDGAPQDAGGGGGSAAPNTNQNVFGREQSEGVTQNSYGTTTNPGVVQTFNWGVNGKLKNSTTTYK